jgi:polyhydroxybutyrate depolymerase
LAQEEDLAVEHQGIARHVLLHMPSAAPANKLPAVIYLHGVRPADWKNHTQREIDTLADRDGVLAAYPEAIGHRWNYATAIKDPQKIGDAVADDIGFIKKADCAFDRQQQGRPSRIYVFGDSRGGLMTYTVMCQLADQIAAAGPLITGMSSMQIAECNPARPVPLFAVGGPTISGNPMMAFWVPNLVCFRCRRRWSSGGSGTAAPDRK